MELFEVTVTPSADHDSNLDYYEAFIYSNGKISQTHIFFKVNDYVNHKSKNDFYNFKHYEFIAKWRNPLGSKCFVKMIISYEVFTDTFCFDLMTKEFEDKVKSKVFEFLSN